MTDQQQILEVILAGGDYDNIQQALPDVSDGMIEYCLRRLEARGDLVRDGQWFRSPDNTDAPLVSMPDIPARLDWPTDAQMLELKDNPQYKHRGGVCPTCGKEEGSDQVGTFRHDGQTWICPDDDRGHIRLRLAYHYWIAGIPVEYQTLPWDRYPHPSVKDDVDEYLNRIDRMSRLGMGFLVSGVNRGTGKTWLTAHVLKEAVKRGYSGWWTSFSDMARLYGLDDRAERDRILEKMRTVQHLVVDDVLKPVSEPQRALFESQWEEVVRFRTVMGFPTHISTNLPEEEIESLFPRVYSLLSAKQFGVQLAGNDARIVEARRRNIAMAMSDETEPIT